MYRDDLTCFINTWFQSALNASQGHKPSYTKSNPIRTLIAKQGHKPSFQQLYILIPNDGDDLTCVIKTGFQDYSLAVNSTELLYKLTLFKYLMSRVNMN